MGNTGLAGASLQRRLGARRQAFAIGIEGARRQNRDSQPLRWPILSGCRPDGPFPSWTQDSSRAPARTLFPVRLTGFA